MRKLTLPGMLILAIPLLFYACKKENTQSNLNLREKEIVHKVSGWLNQQRSAANRQRNARIRQLEENLDWSRLRLEDLNNGERFIIIPVAKGFAIGYNVDKNPLNHLLLILDKTGGIRKGEIVQYIPNNPQDNTVPDNTFYALFNSRKVNADGRFVFLSLFDRHLYEFMYKDGSLTAFTVMQPKDKPAATASREGETCIDWYLITTIYYMDGTHETTEEYVGTTCYGSCQPGERCDELDGGVGGGIEDSPSIETGWDDWVVEESSSGFWYIISIEEFKGVKIPSQRDGGYFTGITHRRSDIVAVSAEYTWQEYIATVAINGPAAKSQVSGKVTYSGPLPGQRYINSPPHYFSVRGVFYK